jgi:hypothetical protein
MVLLNPFSRVPTTDIGKARSIRERRKGTFMPTIVNTNETNSPARIYQEEIRKLIQSNKLPSDMGSV